MSTKRLGLLLIITPVLGFMGWFASGGPTTPAGNMEGGYGAFAAEFVGINTDQLHIAMAIAAIGFGLMTACLIGLRSKVIDNGNSLSAYLSGFLLIMGLQQQ